MMTVPHLRSGGLSKASQLAGEKASGSDTCNGPTVLCHGGNPFPPVPGTVVTLIT